jgi:predicted AAA+ superfamily ATPase
MALLVPRPRLLKRIEDGFGFNPAVLIQGPRQCGKTHLARQFAAGLRAEYFDARS